MKAAARALTLAAALFSGAAGASRAQAPAVVSKPAIESLGAIIVPNRLKVGDTLFGGISGLSYDPDRRQWLMISDDKSEYGLARLYRATVTIEGGRLSALRIRRTVTLRRPDGTPFPPPPVPNKSDGDPNFVDGEAVAYAPDTHTVLWTSEGNWATGRAPSIREARADGRPIRILPTPAYALTSPDRTTGPRDNGDFEAMCLSADLKSIWVGLEQPLLQDGPMPTDTTGAVLRLTRLDRATGAVQAQYAYPVEPRLGGPAQASGADGPALVECAALPNGKLLTLERSYSPGVANFIHVYLADPAGAQDIAGLASLAGLAPRPVAKTLVLDLNATNIPFDNFEGLALGPALPDGRRLMLMAVDDNFRASQKSIIAAFALDLAALEGSR